MWQCVKCREQVGDDFGVCWNCGTAPDGTEDPGFRRAEDVPADAPADPAAEREAARAVEHACSGEQLGREPSPESEVSATCPLCGAAAERGCVYGSDKGWSLRWYSGPPGFWANVATGLGCGEAVVGFWLGADPYAEGVRCDRCRRIVLGY